MGTKGAALPRGGQALSRGWTSGRLQMRPADELVDEVALASLWLFLLEHSSTRALTERWDMH